MTTDEIKYEEALLIWNEGDAKPVGFRLVRWGRTDDRRYAANIGASETWWREAKTPQARAANLMRAYIIATVYGGQDPATVHNELLRVERRPCGPRWVRWVRCVRSATRGNTRRCSRGRDAEDDSKPGRILRPQNRRRGARPRSTTNAQCCFGK